MSTALHFAPSLNFSVHSVTFFHDFFMFTFNYSSLQRDLPLLSCHTGMCIHPVYPINVHFYASLRTGSVSGTFSLLLNILKGNFSATCCLYAAVCVSLLLDVS